MKKYTEDFFTSVRNIPFFHSLCKNQVLFLYDYSPNVSFYVDKQTTIFLPLPFLTQM